MSTEPRIVVTYKAEGMEGGMSVGPVFVIDEAAADADPNVRATGSPGAYVQPFGYDPPWCEKKGWMSWSEANAIAESLGVKLQEY